MFEIVIIIFGLILFEVISSIDNAIINAHVLTALPEKFKKFFLFWGLLFAVFIVRGLLPFAIIWIANPAMPVGTVFSFVFSGEADIEQYVHATKPMLLLGGGMYLVLVFLGWLFLEEKKYAFLVEKFIHRQSVWFYAITSIFLTLVTYFSLRVNPLLALASSIGATAFFMADGFRHNAQEQEKKLLKSNLSSWSKILYLEVLDASFSIDGVIGAFAFTMSVPLILIGNGIGAFVVREFTIRGANTVAKFAYLKNGAMYSIGVLGMIMVLEGFGREYPFWLAPVNTFVLLAVFLWLSWKEIKVKEKADHRPVMT
ncbi:MAG: DUF475 domain-containing protein [Patescibacteria group bacterium]